MVRLKRGKIARQRRKKILQASQKFRGAGHRLYRLAKQRKLKSEIMQYQHRKLRKRLLRKLWIIRLNSILNIENQKYSQWIHLKLMNQSKLNRKSLSQLYLYDPSLFSD